MYSKEPPELAVKRMLLENILLLASRRPPMSDTWDFSDVEVRADMLPPVHLMSYIHYFRRIKSFGKCTADVCRKSLIIIWTAPISGETKPFPQKRLDNATFVA